LMLAHLDTPELLSVDCMHKMLKMFTATTTVWHNHPNCVRSWLQKRLKRLRELQIFS
jgi:hypothetical protein